MPEMKYIGLVSIIGIPARTLSAAEVEQHGGVELLQSTGLYEPIEEQPKPRAKRKPRVKMEE